MKGVPAITKTKTIKQSVFLTAKPAEVYSAILQAKIHSAFTGSKATCAPRVGGKFTAYDGYIRGKNLDLIKDRKIVQEWQTTEWPQGAPPSVVEFTLQGQKGGTELTMVHSEVPAEQAESYRQGWIDYYWEPLKAFFGHPK
jgi:activator of HSP90 ATPase